MRERRYPLTGSQIFPHCSKCYCKGVGALEHCGHNFPGIWLLIKVYKSPWVCVGAHLLPLEKLYTLNCSASGLEGRVNHEQQRLCGRIWTMPTKWKQNYSDLVSNKDTSWRLPFWKVKHYWIENTGIWGFMSNLGLWANKNSKPILFPFLFVWANEPREPWALDLVFPVCRFVFWGPCLRSSHAGSYISSSGLSFTIPLSFSTLSKGSTGCQFFPADSLTVPP